MKPLLAALATFAILAGCASGGGAPTSTKGGTVSRPGGGVSRLTKFQRIAFRHYVASRLGPSTSPDDYRISEKRSGGFVVVTIWPKKITLLQTGGSDVDGYSTDMFIDVKTGKIVKATIGT